MGMKSWEITDKTPVGEILPIVESPTSSLMPFGFQNWHNVQEAYRQGATNFISNMPPYPEDKFRGRGIVTCGGGGYFLCAWVCANILRYHGCDLPMEMWYLDAHEMDPKMTAMMESVGVKCINARELAATTYPCRILNGYELKIYAMKWSSFEEILFLDADNVCAKNPEFLFSLTPYQKTGSIFWRDRRGLPGHVAGVFGINDFRGTEFESGQAVVDKHRCWKELSLAMWYAEHSEFVFKHLHGDKDCFHLGWKRLGTEFTFAPGMRDVHGIFAQPDLSNNELFYHRSNQKWRWEGNNEYWPIDKVAIQIIKELRKAWSGEAWVEKQMSPDEKLLTQELEGKTFFYHIDNKVRIITLAEGQKLNQRDFKGTRWRIDSLSSKKVLSILDGNSPVCSMVLDEDGIWRGRGFFGNRPPVALVPEGKKLDTKQAFVIVGPESSGVLSMVELLTELGAVSGPAFDGAAFSVIVPAGAANTVVVGRTLPHGRVWLDPKDMVGAFRTTGYSVTLVVMNRSWKQMEELQTKRNHVGDSMTADSNILRAYAVIFDAVVKAEIDYIMVNSHELLDGTFRDWLITRLGFSAKTDFIPKEDSE